MARVATETGGRAATTGVIPGQWALSVGNPNTPAAPGFRWVRLTDVARLESGHTPSRSKPEYWDGDIPWIGIRDATANHGLTIHSTNQTVTDEGIANSSARVLPAGTVCLSRTASVGYVVSMGVPMATSQDFVNWVCGPDLSPKLLHYILMCEQASVRRFAHGTTHQTVYYPEAKAFHICVPERRRQDAIAEMLGGLDDKIAVNERIATTAEALVRAIFAEDRWTSRTPLHTLCSLKKDQLKPAEMSQRVVAHYSLPAYDSGRAAELTSPDTIKSAKFLVAGPSVLLSKLNPDIPRVWNVTPTDGIPALASTEFLVLAPKAGIDPSEVWAVTNQQGFLGSLVSKVTGTSKSHQRVRPAEVMAAEVVDPRSLGAERAKASVLSLRAARARSESRCLATLRNTLLPKLISGELPIKDAEQQVENAT